MANRFAHIKCISLDLDGTLLLSHAARLKIGFIFHYLKIMGRRHGYLYSLRSLRQLQNSIEEVADTQIAERAVARFAQLFNYDKLEAEAMYRDTVKSIFLNLRSQFISVPEAPKYLSLLAKRYQLVLGTNPVWPPEIASLRMQWGNLDARHFKVISHANNFKTTKPHINYYRELAVACGHPADQILHIGNSMRKDAPAIKVGMEVALLKSVPAIVKKNGIFFATWKQLMEELI